MYRLSERIYKALDYLEYMFDDDDAGHEEFPGFTLDGGYAKDKYNITFSSDEGTKTVRGETIEELDKNFNTICTYKLRELHELGDPYPDGEVIDMDLSGMGVR